MYFFLIVSAIYVLDQCSKLFIVRTMELHQSLPVINNVFHITHVHNYGAAFGILAHRTEFFIMVALLVVLLILAYLKYLPEGHHLLRIALALQLGGALGNLSDRVRLGFVVDFFDFRVFPVFNIADMAIVIGVGFVVFDLARAPREKGI